MRVSIVMAGLAIAAAVLSTRPIAQEKIRATFNADGSVNTPEGWRQWVFVGAPLTPIAPTAVTFPTETCNACHEANAETDFVFTQYYPVLRAAKP